MHTTHFYTSTSTSTSMATTSITITHEAYKYLKSIKGDKSFSETILSLKQHTNDIMQYAGALKNADFTGARNARKEINKDWTHRGRH